MGTLGVGIMNSMTFSLSTNNNPEVDEIQIPFRTVDFQPHQSSFAQVFKSMGQDMDLTIRNLNFHVGSLGSIHLSDLMKPGPSASESKTVAMSKSSEGSSSEVNSPVSLAKAEEGKIAGGNETMENFQLEVHFEDLVICHNDTSEINRHLDCSPRRSSSSHTHSARSRHPLTPQFLCHLSRSRLPPQLLLRPLTPSCCSPSAAQCWRVFNGTRRFLVRGE
jgi:hypothetical protein